MPLPPRLALPPARLLVVSLVALACGCARYQPAPVNPQLALAGSLPAAGPLGFEEAVRWTVEHNPELRALRSRVGAVGAPPGEPVEVGAGANEDGRANVGASIEALSLLGIGPRAADRSVAAARRSEAWALHHERARALAVDLAEAFAVERALTSLPQPEYEVDVSAFIQAGLESSAAETATSATRAEWDAEVALREAERASNRSGFARLLGLGTHTAPPMTLESPDWPVVPEPAPAALTAARADIQRLVAAFEVADAELRRAVAGQYPGLLLEPEVALDPTALFGAVRLRLPIGAGAQVRAAQCAREAARADVEAGVLAALDEARRARAAHHGATVALRSARLRAEASVQVLRAARTHLEASSGSVIDVVFAADAVVAAARALREASVEEARARVRAAAAGGWPRPPTR